MTAVTSVAAARTEPPSLLRHQRRLAMGFALIAGYVDAYSFRAFHTYVSFMSGNTTDLGASAGQLRLSVSAALAIVCFVLGAAAGTYSAQSALRGVRRLQFAAIAALLAAACAAVQLGPVVGPFCIAVLSFAMGLMNTLFPKIGAETVGLTFMTGDLNRIGSHLALALRRSSPADAQGPWDTQLRRAGLLASLWASFAVGAIASSAILSLTSGRSWSLALPSLALVALALRSDAEATRATQPIPSP